MTAKQARRWQTLALSVSPQAPKAQSKAERSGGQPLRSRRSKAAQTGGQIQLGVSVEGQSSQLEQSGQSQEKDSDTSPRQCQRQEQAPVGSGFSRTTHQQKPQAPSLATARLW